MWWILKYLKWFLSFCDFLKRPAAPLSITVTSLCLWWMRLLFLTDSLLVCLSGQNWLNLILEQLNHCVFQLLVEQLCWQQPAGRHFKVVLLRGYSGASSAYTQVQELSADSWRHWWLNFGTRSEDIFFRCFVWDQSLVSELAVFSFAQWTSNCI